jgi:EAL domain-containing protein (putative c-di-GMP-specific phosphodiesterase class I)
MTAQTLRLLGFAFASADLMFEIDRAGRITAALGAAVKVSGRSEQALTGADWRTLFEEADRPMAEALLAGLDDGGVRRGPVSVRMAGDDEEGSRTALLSLARLPQAGGATSGALTLGPSLGAGLPTATGPDGLHDAESFDALTGRLVQSARADGLELDVTLVELDSDEPVESAASRRIAAVLRAESYAGAGAAQLGEGRYAVLRQRGDSAEALAARIEGAAAVAGIEVAARAAAVSLDAAASPESALKALRYVIDDFLREGVGQDPSSVALAFQARAAQTAARAEAFTRMVDRRGFALAFQPIVSLRTGAPHHYEVLARFEGDQSPFDTIRMAEELDLIQQFDLAMTEAALDKLQGRAGGLLKLAVNLSGRSIMSESFIDQLLRVLAPFPEQTSRLIFEVTESSALSDLDVANVRIQALRKRGFRVCLDDFGAGAASFAYLRALHVDSVKIDGRFVRDMVGQPRDGALIRHLASLCRDLEVTTVAEMVETAETEAALKAVGVDYAQGYLYGRPQPEPIVSSQTLKPAPVAARRIGAVETWS